MRSTGTVRWAASDASAAGESPCADTVRRKVWEIDPGLLCSILGTCLDVDDLRRVARKAHFTESATLRDYDIHGYFVAECSRRSELSKLVHKALDRKYETQIARYKPLRSAEQLWAQWQKSLADGDVSGGNWALMTHGSTPAVLQSRAHNEVHMLSHLMGRYSRDSLRRVRELEQTCAELSERLAKARVRNEAALQERDAQILALEARLAAMCVTPAAAVVIPSSTLPSSGRELRRLTARQAVLERRLKAERGRARNAEGRLAQLLQVSPERVASVRARPQSVEPVPAHPPVVDLHGRAVLYVGGHANVAPIYAGRRNA